MKRITEKQVLRAIADYEQVVDRAEEVFCWLRDTDKRFKKEECGGYRLQVESISFEANLWVHIHSSSSNTDPVDTMLPFQYLWMTNAEIAAERAEMEVRRLKREAEIKQKKATQKHQEEEQYAREREANERKRLRELAAKYPDEAGS